MPESFTTMEEMLSGLIGAFGTAKVHSPHARERKWDQYNRIENYVNETWPLSALSSSISDLVVEKLGKVQALERKVNELQCSLRERDKEIESLKQRPDSTYEWRCEVLQRRRQLQQLAMSLGEMYHYALDALEKTKQSDVPE
jgi:predicted RNase H-like nuclease (RuvC/YqgF family)